MTPSTVSNTGTGCRGVSGSEAQPMASVTPRNGPARSRPPVGNRLAMAEPVENLVDSSVRPDGAPALTRERNWLPDIGTVVAAPLTATSPRSTLPDAPTLPPMSTATIGPGSGRPDATTQERSSDEATAER